MAEKTQYDKFKDPGPIAVKAAELMTGFWKAGTFEEGGENRGKQVKAFLKSVGLKEGNPWCAAAIRHCIEKAAQYLTDAGEEGIAIPPDFPDSGYTPDYKIWGKKHRRWIPVQDVQNGYVRLKKGDLALFYFPAKQRIAHIGIVVEPMGTSGNALTGFKSAEGNTGPDRKSGEINRDGDGVYVKTRSFASLGEFGGFVRLEW